MLRDQDPLKVAVATLLPGVAMVAAHCAAKFHFSLSKDPHLEACAAFGVAPTKKVFSNPHSLFGHMWVHRNDGHLVSNLVSFVFVMSEFRPEPYAADSLTGGTVESGLRRSLKGLAVMLCGSILGGIPATIADYARQKASLKQRHGLGVPLLEKAIDKVSDWQKDWSILCGASAGIMALSGFNSTFYDKYASGLVCLLQVVLAAWSDPQTEPSLFALGGTRVGHAAHLGGFVAGAFLGYVCRKLGAVQRGRNTAGRRLGR